LAGLVGRHHRARQRAGTMDLSRSDRRQHRGRSEAGAGMDRPRRRGDQARRNAAARSSRRLMAANLNPLAGETAMISKISAFRRAAAAAFLASAIAGAAAAQDVVRYGAQVGAQYSLNVLLKENQAKYNLRYDIKDFRSGTENILALEQREVD